MPIIDSDFVGGGVENVHFIDKTHIEFSAPMGGSPQSLWYYFRVNGGKGEKLHFSQKGLNKVLGVKESRGYAPVVPVFKNEDNEWERICEDDIAYCEEQLSYEFSVTPECNEFYLAFCYPYLLEDFMRFIQKQNTALIAVRTLGKTQEGRDYPCVLVGYPEKPEVNKAVLLFARQHAGEVSASFVLEGFLASLLGDKVNAKKALESTVFCIFPIVDLDSVQSGRYGKDRYPIDFNRDWSHNPYHCEIGLIQKELDRLSNRYSLVWGFDLHAPQPGGASYMPPNRNNTAGSAQWEQMWSFALAYEDFCKKAGCSFHVNDVDTAVLNWGTINFHSLINRYIEQKYGCHLLCFEYTYHRTQDNTVITPKDWRKMGDVLFNTLAETVLLHDGLNKKPDVERIPTWAVPAVYINWDTIVNTSGVELTENNEKMRIKPIAEKNRVWLSSKNLFTYTKAEKILSITSEIHCNLRLHYAFFKNGEFMENSTCKYFYISGTQAIDSPLNMTNGSNQFLIMLDIDDICGEVLICLGG